MNLHTRTLLTCVLLHSSPRGRPRIEPVTNRKGKLWFGQKELEPHQYLLDFGVANWGKDRANNDLTLDYKTNVLVYYYQEYPSGMKHAISHHAKSLAKRNLEITSNVASVADECKDWLLPKIEIVISKYEEDKLGLPPRSRTNV